MTNEIARRVVQSAFRSAAELQELLGFLRQNCSSDEYQGYAVGIAAAVDSINVEVLNKVLKAHPELAARIETELAKSGRLEP